jgi:hypothetical protein
MCSGPEFAVGEVYGLRQWYFAPEEALLYAPRSATNKFGDPFRLYGHHNYDWPKARFMPRGHSMMCDTGYTEIDTEIRFQKSFFVNFTYSEILRVIVREIVVQGKIAEHVSEHNGAEKANTSILIHAPYAEIRRIRENSQDISPEVFMRLRGVLNELSIGLTTRMINRPVEEVRELLIEDGYQRAMRLLGSVLLSNWAVLKQSWSELEFKISIDYPYQMTHERSDQLVPDCTCGFYAYTDPVSLREHSMRNSSAEFNSMVARYAYSTVFGVIKGYGTTVIGTKGFRASRAEIVALTMPQFARNRSTWGPMSFKPPSLEDLEHERSLVFARDETPNIFTESAVRHELEQYTTSGKVYRSYSSLIGAWNKGTFGSVQ